MHTSLLTLSRRTSRRPKLSPGRAVAYLRASTAKQAASPAAQLGAIRAWADKHGVEVVEVFEDKATSGDADLVDRPAVMSAVDAIRKLGAGVVVVTERTRLGRDRLVAGLLERLINKAGAVVVSVDGLSAGVGPEADLLRGVTDLFSEFEVQTLRARTRNALAYRKAAGLRVGGIEFGMKLGRDGRRLVPHEGERRTLKLIHRLRRNRSLRELSAELVRRRVPNRSGRFAWSVGQLQRLLSRPR